MGSTSVPTKRLFRDHSADIQMPFNWARSLHQTKSSEPSRGRARSNELSVRYEPIYRSCLMIQSELMHLLPSWSYKNDPTVFFCTCVASYSEFTNGLAKAKQREDSRPTRGPQISPLCETTPRSPLQLVSCLRPCRDTPGSPFCQLWWLDTYLLPAVTL
jgi:hypothetical protein